MTSEGRIERIYHETKFKGTYDRAVLYEDEIRTMQSEIDKLRTPVTSFKTCNKTSMHECDETKIKLIIQNEDEKEKTDRWKEQAFRWRYNCEENRESQIDSLHVMFDDYDDINCNYYTDEEIERIDKGNTND